MNLPFRLQYLFAAFVFLTVDAQACSCARGSLEEAIAETDDIALVTVRDVDFVQTDAASSEAPSAPQHARFTVNRNIKGDMARHRELRSGYGFGDCGVPLIAGASYVVFASGDGPAPVRLCSGFFGPYALWGGARRDGKVTGFLDAIAQHLKTQSPIPRPPRADWGLGDSTVVWFGPPEPPRD
ncbi:hypothetical protein ACFJIW_07760 [Tahibacter sp. UC22_41]|uniref:hypothetical protein n=1 Tax=Tahibacter sp. UC22_41 TaxID=3350178 RepID=UPI0036D93303